MPGFERLTQLELDALVIDLTAEREAEFALRLVPFGAEGEAVRPQVRQHFEEILPDEMRQHEPVVQRRSPARQRPVQRIAPKAGEDGADQ